MIVLSCYRESDEFEGLPLSDELSKESVDPLAFLGYLEEENDANSSGAGADESIAVAFEKNYANIKQWGKVRFAQQTKNLKPLEKSKITDVLFRSRKGTRLLDVYPFDTKIGKLEIEGNRSSNIKNIVSLINKFFNLMKNQNLDEKLTEIVLDSELPILSRQLSRSIKYGHEISEVRIGEIVLVDENQRSAAIRVIRKSEDFESRAAFQFYFVSVDNKWVINAIEGDFAELEVKYGNPGKFVPLGTTGVTQGF